MYGQNGQIPQFLEIFSQKNTVLEINGKVPLFLKLEFQKLEFLNSFPPWHCWVGCVRLKKCLRYSSLANSSTIYTVLESTRLEYLFKKKKKIYTVLEFTYTVLEFGKLEYCVNFFFPCLGIIKNKHKDKNK